MAYPEHLIHDGETVALDLNPHWWFFIQHIAVGTGILGLIAIYLSFSALDGLLKPIIAGLLIFWAIWLGIRFMAWRNTYFVVTDRRVIFRSGFVAKRGVEIPLGNRRSGFSSEEVARLGAMPRDRRPAMVRRRCQSGGLSSTGSTRTRPAIACASITSSATSNRYRSRADSAA